MARERKSNPVGKIIMWCILALVVSWGVWQFFVVRQSILAELHAGRMDTGTAAGAGDSGGGEGAGDTDDVRRRLLDDPAGPTAAAEGADVAVHVDPGTAPAATQETPVDEGKIESMMAAARQSLDAGDVVAGRGSLNAALAALGERPGSAALREQLAGLNGGVFLGTEVVADDPYVQMVPIVAGDSLDRIAHRYLITPDLVAVLNPQLSPRNLRTGTPVKVVVGAFHARLLKGSGRVDLYARDMYVRSFGAVIEQGNLVPVGTYRVKADGKTIGGGHVWIALEPAAAGGGTETLWLYGSGGLNRPNASGIQMGDSDLAGLYNTLVERESLVRVDP